MKSKLLLIIICILGLAKVGQAQDQAIIDKILKESCVYNGTYYEGSPRVEYRDKLNIYVLYLYGLNEDKEMVLGVYDNIGNCIVSPVYITYGFTSDSDLSIFAYHGNNKIAGYKEVAKRQNKKFPYLYGIIDMDGKEILPCRYSSIHLNYSLPIAIVVEGEQYTYEKDSGFREDLVRNGKWGLFDMENKKWLIPCKYEYIDGGQWSPSGCLVEKGAYSANLDKWRNYAYLPFNIGGNKKDEFDDPIGGKWGMLDIYGNIVIASEYSKIKKLKDGNIQVFTAKNKEIAILNPQGGKPFVSEASTGKLNKVDKNIPRINGNNNETFAFIIGNERYNSLGTADYAINDAKIFAEYCLSTLCLPKENVFRYEDVSYGSFIGMLQKLQDIAEAYDGDANFIFYYSGNGLKDASGNRYLLTSDANDGFLDKTSISMSSLINILDGLNCKMALCLIDAPFSGNNKSGNPISSNRGIAIASPAPSCNRAIIAMSGDESRSSEDYSHSLFTYYILENLQKNKGNTQLGQMLNDASTNSSKTAISLGFNSPKPEIINLTNDKSKISLR